MAPSMNHFTKAVCVLDTCSIINLDDIELAGNDVLFYMRRFFDVQVCGVIREEFQRHKDKVSSREASYWNSFLSNATYYPTVLNDDTSVVGPFYSAAPSFTGTEDAGEHGNARVALELLITRSAGHAIFVTDDENACNAFLRTMQRSFPAVHLWNSADVILHLGGILLKEKKTNYENIRCALRDVYAAGAKKWHEVSDAEKATIIKNQNKSVKSLRLLQKVVDHWRN